jgi:hypothetical protein
MDDAVLEEDNRAVAFQVRQLSALVEMVEDHLRVNLVFVPVLGRDVFVVVNHPVVYAQDATDLERVGVVRCPVTERGVPCVEQRRRMALDFMVELVHDVAHLFVNVLAVGEPPRVRPSLTHVESEDGQSYLEALIELTGTEISRDAADIDTLPFVVVTACWVPTNVRKPVGTRETHL